MARAKQKTSAPIPAHAWQDCLEAFKKNLEANERSRHTIRNYGHDLAQFRLWYESKGGNDRKLETVDQVNAVQFREWKSWMQGKAATATVNRRLSALHSFLEWAFNNRRLGREIERPKAIRQKRLGHRGLRTQG